MPTKVESDKITIDGYQFTYDPSQAMLSLLGGGSTKQAGLWNTLYLSLILKAGGKPVNFSDPRTYEGLPVEMNKSNLHSHRRGLEPLRLHFCNLVGRDQKTHDKWPLKSERVSSGIQGTAYTLDGTIEPVYFDERNSRIKGLAGYDPASIQMEIYDAMAHRAKQGEKHMPLLIDQLLHLFGADLMGFFFETRTGTKMPFHLMDEGTYGTPTFPIPIEDTENPIANRANDSLLTQRRVEGRKLNNGSIYSLQKAKKDGWSLGRTNYFNILDSSDYLRERILSEWARLFDHGTERDQLQFLKTNRLVQEWLKNVRAIRMGDFSTYQAGIAFTMPLFSTSSSNLELVCAKGSTQKATGGGKFHCCPAGMLEYYHRTDSS